MRAAGSAEDPAVVRSGAGGAPQDPAGVRGGAIGTGDATAPAGATEAPGPADVSDPAAAPGAADAVEGALLTRVLSTLLREDVCGLRTRTTAEDRPDGRWLRLSGAGDEDLLLPVRPDGFQCEYGARLPLLRAEPAGKRSVGRAAVGSQSARTPGRTGGTAAPSQPASHEAPAPLEAPAARPMPAQADVPAADSASAGYPAADSSYASRAGRELTDGEDVLAAVARFAAPEDAAGFAAFAAEYRAALTSLRLQEATRQETMARLTARHGPGPAAWRGPIASLGFDTLAARLGHPLYPTSAARPGLTTSQLLAHAPEFAPRFALRWLAVPREAVTLSGVTAGEPLTAFWPLPSDLGMAGLDRSHIVLPVHPLTAAGPLDEALRAAGLAGHAVLAERGFLTAEPTLSTRTVALLEHPGVHLKLPLATATLGLLNRRTIKPGTLVDGAAAERLLAAVTAREPRFQGRVLHYEETRWAYAGHELLAVLVRRQPAGIEDGCTVLPLAALPAAAPDGRLVADHLADRYTGGDPVALLDAVLTLLLDWQATLFGYGIALESHQQNISLVLDEHAGATRVRLLFKDDDGLRINRHRLAAALGPGATGPGGSGPGGMGSGGIPPGSPGPADFDDPRITVDDDGPLLALFTTITVHLCAAAPAVALSGPGRVPLPVLLRLVRDRLDQAAARLGGGPGGPGEALRAAVLEADRLPVKAMVTAGTLLSKRRSGASDINKHYTTGPNYLLHESR